MTARLMLNAGKERSLFRRHPWIFAGAVERLHGGARPGDTVEVVSGKGEVLAKAAYSPSSQIRARVWSFEPEETIDDAFFKRRVAAAVARRRSLPELRSAIGPMGGLRLIHGESDGLPGVIADRYGDTVVVQLTSAGADKWRKAIAGALVKATSCARIYERSDSEVRSLEGLDAQVGWLHGEPCAVLPLIEEDGIRFEVDIVAGHKTGFYLDQRENRQKIQAYVRNAEVLNLFAYTGGFAVAALRADAKSVVNVDSSADVLQLAQENVRLNGLPASASGFVAADVFSYLRKLRAEQRTFDVIIADPPKLAQTQGQIEKAARAYKDLNLVALQLLRPGGYLITFSCSGLVTPDLFQKIVFGAAVDAGRDVQVIERLSQASDHPVLLSFPEGEYLKGLVCRVVA